jgi:hypothetical protein
MFACSKAASWPFILVSALLAVTAAGWAMAGPEKLLGRWSNENPNARDVSSILIKEGPGGPVLQVFGKCHPTDCDWGTAPAHLYTHGVSGDPHRDLVAITAHFDAGFAEQQIIIHIIDDGHLHYEVLNHFKDGSGRSHYAISGELRPAAN